MAFIKHMITGERYSVLRVSKQYAERVGISISENDTVLQVKRFRIPGQHYKNPISITSGDVIFYSNVTDSGASHYYYVSDFQAFRRYQGQKRMDTGYLVLKGVDLPHLSLVDE